MVGTQSANGQGSSQNPSAGADPEGTITPPNNREEETPMEETLDQRHARLQQETERLRKQRECEEMQRLIDGRPPAIPPLAADSIRTDFAPFKQPQIRLAAPASFKATDLKEYEEYEASWKTQLEVYRMEENNAISLAATYLQGDARLAWVHKKNTPATWDDYLTWCRDLVSDPQNRLSYALQEIKKLQQTNQPTREIWLKLKGLKRDIPELSHDEREAWDLLTVLSPEIRDRVLTDHDNITHYEQVLLSAKKYEDRRREKAQYKRDADGQQSGEVHKRTRIAGRPDSSKFKKPFTPKPREGSDSQEKDKSFSGTCYKCGQKGHRKNNCTAKATSGIPAPSSQGSKN
jgi:Zinc knuckle